MQPDKEGSFHVYLITGSNSESLMFQTVQFVVKTSIDGFYNLEGGGIKTEDEHRPCHPISVRNEQTLLWVKQLIEEDPHILYQKYVNGVTSPENS